MRVTSKLWAWRVGYDHLIFLGKKRGESGKHWMHINTWKYLFGCPPPNKRFWKITCKVRSTKIPLKRPKLSKER